jgi:two-component system OmpR family sensor kinase
MWLRRVRDMSLRRRLLAAVGAVALVALVAASAVTYVQLRSFLVQRVDQSLEQAHIPFEGQARQFEDPGPGGTDFGGPGSGPGDPNPSAPGAGFPFVLFAEVRSASGDGVHRLSTSFDHGTAVTPSLPTRITGFTRQPDGERVTYFTTSSATAGGPPFRVRAEQLAGGSVLVVAQPIDDVVATLHRLFVVELVVLAVAVAVALVVGRWLVGAALRPLTDVERTAEAIAEGRLHERVPGENGRTEVGRLARTLNVMLGRIERAFAERDATEAELRASEERLRRFVADASHELRTPLAAVSAYAELFERGASDRPADLRRVLHGIRDETSRMGSLVEDLLLLARLDEGRPLAREPVELVALAADAVGTAATVGPEWPVRLRAAAPVETRGDRDRLRQILDNLLANVRAHTPPGTVTDVSVTAGDDWASLTVHDSGPGLPPAEVERLFERFYRADPSRSRSHGGAGLGLSIVAAIAAAHGGRVRAASRPGEGTSVTVELPAEPAVPRPGVPLAGGTRARGPAAEGTLADGPQADKRGPGVPADEPAAVT